MKKIAAARIGSAEFLVDDSLEGVEFRDNGAGTGFRDNSPAIKQMASGVRENLVELVGQLRSEFHQVWEDAKKSPLGPDELAVEVSFAFESGVNAWIIVGKGSTGVTASFKWNRSEHS